MKSSIVSLVAFFAFFGFVNFHSDENSQSPTEREVNRRVNPVVFWELASNDAEASVEFFEEIFGWKIQKMPNTILYDVSSRAEDRGIDGGIFTLQKAKLPFLTVYILVDDIEEKARLIEQSGGFIVSPPHEISGGSWICLFNDPSGVTFAMLRRATDER